MRKKRKKDHKDTTRKKEITKLVYTYYFYYLYIASLITSLIVNLVNLINLSLILYVNVHKRDELVFLICRVSGAQPQLQVFCSRLIQRCTEEGGTEAATSAVVTAALPVPEEIFRHIFTIHWLTAEPGVAEVVVANERRDVVAPLPVVVGARANKERLCVLLLGLRTSKRPDVAPRTGFAVGQRNARDVRLLHRGLIELQRVEEGMGRSLLVGLNLTAHPSVRVVVDREQDGIASTAKRGSSTASHRVSSQVQPHGTRLSRVREVQVHYLLPLQAIVTTGTLLLLATLDRFQVRKTTADITSDLVFNSVVFSGVATVRWNFSQAGLGPIELGGVQRGFQTFLILQSKHSTEMSTSKENENSGRRHIILSYRFLVYIYIYIFFF